MDTSENSTHPLLLESHKDSKTDLEFLVFDWFSSPSNCPKPFVQQVPRINIAKESQWEDENVGLVHVRKKDLPMKIEHPQKKIDQTIFHVAQVFVGNGDSTTHLYRIHVWYICIPPISWYLGTPLKFNMTSEKSPRFNRKYIFKWWIFHCHVSFRGSFL